MIKVHIHILFKYLDQQLSCHFHAGEGGDKIQLTSVQWQSSVGEDADLRQDLR